MPELDVSDLPIATPMRGRALRIFERLLWAEEDRTGAEFQGCRSSEFLSNTSLVIPFAGLSFLSTLSPFPTATIMATAAVFFYAAGLYLLSSSAASPEAVGGSRRQTWPTPSSWCNAFPSFKMTRKAWVDRNRIHSCRGYKFDFEVEAERYRRLFWSAEERFENGKTENLKRKSTRSSGWIGLDVVIENRLVSDLRRREGA